MSNTLPNVAGAALQQRYVSAASLMFVLYDIAITFDVEVKSIWRSKLTLAKVLFLLNRYLCPAILVFDQYLLAGIAKNKTDDFCGHAILGEYLMQVIVGCGIIPAMLALRVYMLHYGNRIIMAILLFGLCLELVVGFATVISVAQSQGALVIFSSTLNMCLTMTRPPMAWLVWVPAIIFDSTIITLTVLKTWRVAYSDIRTPVISTMLRDGLGFFMVLLNLQIFNIVSFTTFADTLYLIDTPMSFAVSSTLVSRMFLNLRHLSTVTLDDSTIDHGDFKERPPSTGATSNRHSYFHSAARRPKHDLEEDDDMEDEEGKIRISSQA